MTNTLLLVRVAAFVVVMASWLVFVFGFLFRKHPAGESEERKRDGASIAGIVLQGVGYAAIWALQRPHFTPIVPMPGALDAAVSVFAAVLAATSVWLTLAAVRTLGKQWSLAARVVEGHELVTEGVYRIVRNPIYTGMLGKLIATGLVLTHWIGIAIAIPFFLIGTWVRVRSEERLMRETFGAQFDTYKRDVPSLIPFVRF